MYSFGSANYNQTPGKYPKEYIHDSKHDESLKSSIIFTCLFCWFLNCSFITHFHVYMAIYKIFQLYTASYTCPPLPITFKQTDKLSWNWAQSLHTLL